jgi:hypothetical protein
VVLTRPAVVSASPARKRVLRYQRRRWWWRRRGRLLLLLLLLLLLCGMAHRRLLLLLCGMAHRRLLLLLCGMAHRRLLLRAGARAQLEPAVRVNTSARTGSALISKRTAAGAQTYWLGRKIVVRSEGQRQRFLTRGKNGIDLPLRLQSEARVSDARSSPAIHGHIYLPFLQDNRRFCNCNLLSVSACWTTTPRASRCARRRGTSRRCRCSRLASSHPDGAAAH